jgi:apolipoprotein N-acyltransferase
MDRSSFREIRFRSSLVLLTVFLSHLSLPGGPLPIAGIVSLVPLGLAIHGASPLAAAGYAYACAALGWLASTSGLATAFSAYAHCNSAEGIASIAALCLWLALPYALFGLLYGRFQWLDRPAGFLSAAACLTLAVRGFPTPLPIDSSHSLYAFPVLIQILDLGGQPLLLFVFYLFNWALAGTIVRLREHRSPRLALATLLALAVLIPAYGYFRVSQFRDLESGQPVKIAIVQPNIPLSGDSNPHSSDALNPFHTLVDMSASFLSANTTVDLVVWPETPLRIACEDESRPRPQLISLAARFHTPLLINCVQPAPSGGDYNTQLLLLPDGRGIPYFKHRLLPFAEYLPGESAFPILRRLFPAVSRYVPSDQNTVFRIGSLPGVFVAICYEILFPAHAARLIERGGSILVTPSNDAWFGDSRIADFLVAQSVFQAVQYRVPVVRVSNSGNGVHIHASGEIAPGSRTPAFKRTTAVYVVRDPGRRSPYYRLKHSFAYVLP